MMPHATVSASARTGSCPYCGAPLMAVYGGAVAAPVTCPRHADLPAIEPLDDRYTLTEDQRP